MIHVNGKPVQTAVGATIRDVLIGLGIDPDRGGIAVAVDAEIAARGAWPVRTLEDGAQLEIVTAVQGG